MRGMAREMAWVQLFCRGSGCGVMFYICHSCYRGQVYCGERCRRRMRRQQVRRRQPETPGQPGRKARSPGPATGLPEKAPSPARDGSYFRPSPPIRQYQKTMDQTAKKAALLGGISASAENEAVSSRHPARLHCVWAHAGVIGPERGAVIDERNGSTARRCSRSKPRMNFGRRRRQVNRWNSRMNSLHPKEAHFDVWAKEEG